MRSARRRVWLWSTQPLRMLWANPVGAASLTRPRQPPPRRSNFRRRTAQRARSRDLQRRCPPAARPRLERLRGFGASFGGTTSACARASRWRTDMPPCWWSRPNSRPRAWPCPNACTGCSPICKCRAAVFAADGELIEAQPAAQPLIGGRRDLPSLGAAAKLAREASESGRAQGEVGGRKVGFLNSAPARPSRCCSALHGGEQGRRSTRTSRCQRLSRLRTLRMPRGGSRSASSGRWMPNCASFLARRVRAPARAENVVRARTAVARSGDRARHRPRRACRAGSGRARHLERHRHRLAGRRRRRAGCRSRCRACRCSTAIVNSPAFADSASAATWSAWPNCSAPASTGRRSAGSRRAASPRERRIASRSTMCCPFRCRRRPKPRPRLRKRSNPARDRQPRSPGEHSAFQELARELSRAAEEPAARPSRSLSRSPTVAPPRRLRRRVRRIERRPRDARRRARFSTASRSAFSSTG